MVFSDRTHAGHLLALKLSSYKKEYPLVIGLARGGSVVAKAIAEDLSLPCDVLVVKKIPSPFNPELGIGALAPDSVSYVDRKFAQRLGVDGEYVTSQIRQLTDHIRQKAHGYRKGKKPFRLFEKTVILTDDGAATGATIRAAILWLRKKHAKKIILALPVAPLDCIERMRHMVHEVIVLETPHDFSAVGQFYKDFHEVSDEEVVELVHT